MNDGMSRGRLKPETYHAFHVVVFGNIYLPKAHQCRLLQTQTPAIGTLVALLMIV